MKKIISASRRTDIPAFYSDWLMGRLQERVACVRNPFNGHQVSRISLHPDQVAGFVFWTKNPAPLLAHLGALDQLGYSFYFQFTLTGCDQELEPYLPPKKDLIATFHQLSRRIGSERVRWRFDPLVFTQTTPPAVYLQRFAWLAAELEGATTLCTTSLLTLYAKCRRNLQSVPLYAPEKEELSSFAHQLVDIARQRGMILQACCDSFLIEYCGLLPSCCIDPTMFPALVHYGGKERDLAQRSGCRCAKSVDIGAYNSCGHGCLYCYANTSRSMVIQNRHCHHPESPLLIGRLRGDERIKDRGTERQQLSLF